jgi:hypothetical protein
VKRCRNYKPPTHGEVEEEEEFRRIPTFAALLDRRHGGRHRIVRVTEYGGAAGCGALYTILISEQLIEYVHLHDLEIVK